MLKINQGKQDTTKDNTFEVIKKKDVFGFISAVSIHDRFDSALAITIDIIEDEALKGRKVWDTVTFDPTSEHSWKYRSIRKCVGVPYSEKESAEVDIEKILLNKKVKMNLDERIGSDGNPYQKVTYIARKEAVDTKAVEPKDDELDEDPITTDATW